MISPSKHSVFSDKITPILPKYANQFSGRKLIEILVKNPAASTQDNLWSKKSFIRVEALQPGSSLVKV